MDTNEEIKITSGTPYPFGTTLQDDGINFSLISTSAEAVSLILYNRTTRHPIATVDLSPEISRTGDVWHVCINNLDPSEILYAYKITTAQGEIFQPLLDPYAKSVASWHEWGGEIFQGANTPCKYHPFGEIIIDEPFDWENDAPPKIAPNNLIIYEVHVRGFTVDRSSGVKDPGTFFGVIEKIPYLVELGINAVELMPVQEFNEQEYLITHPKSKKALYNYWGYSTINFFAPMARYARSLARGAAIHEFKTMVRSLHKNGIEVILDVVFNHTGEGNKLGPIFSFKGIDNPVYYLLDDKGDYQNFSGCGNTLSANHPVTQELIVHCLRYWVTDMHVDGFRFDLASALTRDTDGNPMPMAPLIKAITEDPVLSHVKLIAEPWDATGLYQVGNFSADNLRWSEWNGKYRDAIRKFLRGASWAHGEFANRLCGSEDLYGTRRPYTSLNFITSHDGFSLADLVSYNTKHNIDNGEDNKDGSSDNQSWNCGEEGDTTNKKVQQLRQKQMRNFHLALLLSQGIPMISSGDEYGHTKHGNNNTWCQDNELNWFLWNKLEDNKDFFRFNKLLIDFRKRHKILRRSTFLTNKDVDWHGAEAFQPEWNSDSHIVAFTLKDHDHNKDIYVAFNAQDHAITLHIPPPPHMKNWRWVINTALPSPDDIYENDRGPIFKDPTYKIAPYSAIVLIAL
jgi:isoamylase/glycogen operon protein